ncbi:MAG TPA: GNAT family N-acetyltransferase [Ktedonobacteraceae bacterium]|nr:GNAT family N-acetyltransferase [Ktedonobacteraceae bacterium]
MSSSSIIVRPLTTAEYRLHFQSANAEFSPDPSPASALLIQNLTISRPEFRAEQLRGAFLDGKQVGSYILHERLLRMGTAHLPTGCIGSVVTYPGSRNQGIATAMMHDAIDYARSHSLALLLLDGIPKFYHRFGYIDVFDQSAQDIDRAAILARPQSSHSVRVASPADAASVLGLYDRHYGPYPGSFTRTLEQQIHRLQYRLADNPLWLAVDADGQIDGYMALRSGADRFKATELAVDNWSAALALLHHHAQLLEGPDAPATLQYLVPPSAPILQEMIDHLEVPDTSHWQHPAEEWVVRSQAFHHRDAGWMARLVDFPTVAQAMLPEWQARWRRSLAHWSGNLLVRVGNADCELQIDGTELQLVYSGGNAAEIIELTAELFMQVLFEYRSIASALRQQGATMRDDVLTVLNILFPMGHCWIPASDWF